jgi:hypothetical protein
MPWLLLIGPGIALLSLLIKFFVAIGYAVTGNFAVVPRSGGDTAVGIYSLDESGHLTDDLWIHLANGERFRGAYVPFGNDGAHTLILMKEKAVDPPDDERRTSSEAELPCFGLDRLASGAEPAGLAVLASDRGRVMRCEFAYDPSARSGFGVCGTDDGETYDVRL